MKKTILFLVMVLMMVSIAYAETGFDYVEEGDSAPLSSEGTWVNLANSDDSNWSTYADCSVGSDCGALLNFTSTIANDSITDVILQYKTTQGTYNYTLSGGCLDSVLSTGVLKLRYGSTHTQKAWIDCYNQTTSAWYQFYAYTLDGFIYEFGVYFGGELCVANWTCDLWGDCQTNDTRNCIQAIDNNTCGYNYTGNYSEFGTDECDYCTPDFFCSNYQNFCPATHIRSCNIIGDHNNCFILTGLESDEFDGDWGDYQAVCGYQGFNYTVEDVKEMGVDTFAIAGLELLTWIRLIMVFIGLYVIIVLGGKLVIEKIKNR